MLTNIHIKNYILVENLLDYDETARLRNICDAMPSGVHVNSEEWWTDYSHQIMDEDKEFLDTVRLKQKDIADILYEGSENYSVISNFRTTNSNSLFSKFSFDIS